MLKQPKLTSFFNSGSVLKEIGNGDVVKRPREASSTSPVKNETKKCKIDEDFGDMSVYEDLDFCGASPLNLEKLNRYRVEGIIKDDNGTMKLTLVSEDGKNFGSCHITPPWDSCEIKTGDMVSLRGKSIDNVWTVDWSGLLITDPDELVSGTTVVGSLFCTRKSILSTLLDPVGSAFSTSSLVVGTAVHDLFQKAIVARNRDMNLIQQLYEDYVTGEDFVRRVFSEGLNHAELLEQISSYLPQIYNFLNDFVINDKNSQTLNRLNHPAEENWSGEIVQVKDIEENIWSPKLGLKGKIDATVRVRPRKQPGHGRIMPLEVKTGRVSYSLEHRGQVILYCMMLQELGEDVNSGLLLYLKEGGGVKEIPARDKEVRDLSLLRNGLVHWLKRANAVTPSQNIAPPVLPPPINRRACSTCEHLVACTSALRMNDYEDLSDKHELRKLAKVNEHLTSKHLDYVFHMMGLSCLEMSAGTTSKVSRIWTSSPAVREEKKSGVTDLQLVSCTVKKHRFECVLTKTEDFDIFVEVFEIGQIAVISTTSRFAVSLGFVTELTPSSITLSFDRMFKPSEGPFTLDSYSSNSASKLAIKNLSLLLEDTPHGAALRQSIIDLEIPPFSPKIPGKIRHLGADLFPSLNREQTRAVLQGVSAERFMLIEGMPGAGKTRTLRIFIRLLLKLGLKVLVCAWTHSAVDNVLRGLAEEKGLRIGSSHRICEELKDWTEDALLARIEPPLTQQKLENTYDSIKLVGVTCLGASTHSWLNRQTFDYCLVDEASQLTQPAALRCLYLARKFVLVGDPKQLPPLVINPEAKENGLGVSLFSRLYRPAVTTQLTLQYRMNSRLNQLSNEFYYEGQLKCGNEDIANSTLKYDGSLSPSVPIWIKKCASTALDDSFLVVDTPATESVMANATEAQLVADLASSLLNCGIKPTQIGVIAVYTAQVKTLRALLPNNIEVNTVDQYQGRDKDVILMSSSKAVRGSEGNIMSDWKRLSVAITRAKYKFVLFGHVETLLSSTQRRSLRLQCRKDEYGELKNPSVVPKPSKGVKNSKKIKGPEVTRSSRSYPPYVLTQEGEIVRGLRRSQRLRGVSTGSDCAVCAVCVKKCVKTKRRPEERKVKNERPSSTQAAPRPSPPNPPVDLFNVEIPLAFLHNFEPSDEHPEDQPLHQELFCSTAKCVTDDFDEEKCITEEPNDGRNSALKICLMDNIMWTDTDKYIFKSSFKDIKAQMSLFEAYTGIDPKLSGGKFDVTESTPSETRRFYRKKITDTTLTAWYSYNLAASTRFATISSTEHYQHYPAVRRRHATENGNRKAEVIWKLNATSDLPTVDEVLQSGPIFLA